MNWKIQAVAWLRGKAAEQAQNNERWPEHAKAYQSWRDYVTFAQRLADELECEPKEDAQPEQEVWLVLDEGGNPGFCAGWPEACHEHINEAISEHDIDEAGKWRVVRAVVTPNGGGNGWAASRPSR